MPAVFVNGNPESAAVWDLLVAELDWTDVVRLSPPGFGAPIPDGFGCTISEYRDWLIDELDGIGEPIDLVAHDVGGSTALSAVMARPDLVRSWVSDSVGVFDPEYAWHELATVWQTEGAGEASVAELLGGSADERAARLTSRGMPDVIARRIAPAQGPEMGWAILSFYRSAAQPAMAELGRGLEAAAKRPGLAMLGSADTFVGTDQMRRRSAARAGAEVAALDGVGHWWMAQDPVRSARAISAFWHSLPAAR